MRLRLFDVLLPLIPVLTVAGAMPLTIAQLLLALMVIDRVTLQRALTAARDGVGQWWPCWAFMGWALLTAVWAIHPIDSAVLWVRIATMILLGALALLSLRHAANYPASPARLYLGFYMASVLVLASALLPQGGAIGLLSQLFDGDLARYLHKTVNRALCALAVLIWPTMELFYLRKKRLWAWAALAVTALPITMLDSVSAQLGMLAGLVCYLACHVLPPRLFRGAIALVPVLALAASYLSALPIPADRKDALNQFSSGRLPIWSAFSEHAANKPLKGWGIGSAHDVPFSAETLTGMKLSMAPMHPHLSFLQVRLELGLIGLVLLAAALGVALRHIARVTSEKPQQALLMATAAAYLVAGLSSFGVWQQWWLATAWLAAMLWARFLRIVPVA